MQASDISQSSIAASNVYNQTNLDSMSQELTNQLQPLETPAFARDYRLSSSVPSKHDPEMELLPAGLVVAILQQVKGKPSMHVLFCGSACCLAKYGSCGKGLSCD